MRPREIAALRQRGSKGGSSGSTYTAPVRQTATVTTSSLANGASWTGNITLAKGFRLISITTNRACRTRLYTDATSRSSDAARAVGTDPADGSGLIFEFVSTGSLLSAVLSPTVDGFSAAVPLTDQIPIAITNLGTTGTVEVSLSFIATEV